MLSTKLLLSSVSLTATCFDYTNVYELNDGFGGPEISRSVEHVRHRHRPQYHPDPSLLKKAPPAWIALEGQGGGHGDDRPQGRRTPP
jgi:hypothetical protein